MSRAIHPLPSGTSWTVLGKLYLTTESKNEWSSASTHPHAFKVCVGIKSRREYVATDKESPTDGTVRTPQLSLTVQVLPGAILINSIYYDSFYQILG
jgi:hypothetical protein